MKKDVLIQCRPTILAWVASLWPLGILVLWTRYMPFSIFAKMFHASMFGGIVLVSVYAFLWLFGGYAVLTCLLVDVYATSGGIWRKSLFRKQFFPWHTIQKTYILTERRRAEGFSYSDPMLYILTNDGQEVGFSSLGLTKIQDIYELSQSKITRIVSS